MTAQVRRRAQRLAATCCLSGLLGLPLLSRAQTADLGNADRGRAIVANRQVGLCLLCHSGPLPEERFQGNLAPSLAGAGSRFTANQLRSRIMDARQINPESIMPAYAKTDGLTRVGKSLHGQPLLNAQQIDDVVAYLVTLK